MSFNSLLNHTCDIYHMTREDKTPGYGLPASPTFSYPNKPDLSGVPCHFNVKDGVAGIPSVKQTEPYTAYDTRVKLILPATTDIRLNDKVVNRENSREYTAEIPQNIRNHHIVVFLRRSSEQKPL